MKPNSSEQNEPPMQGQGSSSGDFPENFFFYDNGPSTADEPVEAPQGPWNGPREPSWPGFPFPMNHGEPDNLGFGFGEPSSISAREGDQKKPEWNFSAPQAPPFGSQHQRAGEFDAVSSGGNNADSDGGFSWDLNAEEYGVSDDDCRIIEPPRDFMRRYTPASAAAPSDAPKSEIASRKRKARESIAQSSGEGSSSLHGQNSDGSGLVSDDPALESNPVPVVETGASNLLRPRASSFSPPFLRGNLDESRWGPGSSSTGRNISPSLPERSDVISVEDYGRNVNRFPVFFPAPSREALNLDPNPSNANRAGGNFITGTAAILGQASSSRAGPSGGANPSEVSFPRQPPPHYRPAPSETVSASPLPLTGGTAAQNGPRGAGSSQPGLDGLGQRARSALLGRSLNAAVELSRSMRAFSAGDDGGNGDIPEHIRLALDAMRREGMRLQDVIALGPAALFAMADANDGHMDMRMDVDNMSYEELLALEEQIGEVCTGLSEENVAKHMKLHKYSVDKAGDGNETEPCSICREEYNEGEDVGKLECGHGFHRDCIKQWLTQKNLCPICKTAGLNIKKK